MGYLERFAHSIRLVPLLLLASCVWIGGAHAAQPKLLFVTQPGNGTEGTALGSQPVVEVRDNKGNTVTTDLPKELTGEEIDLSLTHGTRMRCTQ